jgi:(4S)-4-hydroxy-5-phosphonooxypentane-2,3-dione isomerase
MIATIVHIEVNPEHVDSFIQATRENHFASVKEPGNVRFDFIRNDDYPERFVLYEAYKNKAAAAAHKETPHYLKWKETVALWMAKPRSGIHYTAILPEFQET